MERSPAQVALVVREGVLHERDQRRDYGGARHDQGPAYGIRERACIAVEVPDELLRRGRARGCGVRRMGGMVHDSLLDSVRRAQCGTMMRARPGWPLDSAGLSQHTSSHTPYHTLLLLPRLSCGPVPSPLCWLCANSGYATREGVPWLEAFRVAQFIRICRWLRLIYKERLAPL
jgi:hypothetical protein